MALVGARGYGVAHRRIIHGLQVAGRARLLGICNRGPVEPLDDAPLDGVELFTDHREMLRATRPDVVVVATPAHVRLPVAIDAARAGCHLLVEKPPVADLAEFAELTRVVDGADVACQVGFQALASPALAEVTAWLDAGRIGDVTHFSVSAAWWRPDSYFQRSDWAGRRELAGHRISDGALANQFSHGIAQALAIIAKAPGPSGFSHLEFELYRTRDLEVEDTACLRLSRAVGPPLVAAVTVAADEFRHAEVTVHGGDSAVRLEYPTDRVCIGTGEQWRSVPGRPTLLKNLLDHRADPTVPLAAPLASTRAVVALLDSVYSAEVHRVPAEFLNQADGGVVIRGIAETVRLATARGALFSEMSVPWARRPDVVDFDA